MCLRKDYYVFAKAIIICVSISIICIWNMSTSRGSVIRSQRQSRCDGATVAARVHVLDTDDDAGPCEDIVVLAKTHSGPCEDIVVLAKTHSGASEDTYCGSDDDDDDDEDRNR